MSAIRSQVLGVGSYLPSKVVANTDLAAMGVETSDEWIVQRTGIKQRHLAAEMKRHLTLPSPPPRTP